MIISKLGKNAFMPFVLNPVLSYRFHTGTAHEDVHIFIGHCPD